MARNVSASLWARIPRKLTTWSTLLPPKIAGNTQVQLVWKTVNEQNYFNFTVERSIDSAKTFAVVGGLQATGAGTYSLPDKAPVKGQNLYRLKQEDLNNTISYSTLVRVIFADQACQ